MPEVIDAPPPAEVTIDTPPKPSPGDKFRAALDAAGGPSVPATDDVPPAPKKDEPPPADAKPAAKPSPIDIALAEDKPPAEPKKEEAAPNILAEFDDKKPNWEKARGVMKTQSEEIKALHAAEQKLKDDLAKIDPKLPENLTLTAKERDELKAKNAELLDIITKINVKYSPDYQEKFVKGREKEVERAITRVKQYGGNVEKFTDALALPEGRRRSEALEEALAEVKPIDQPRILGVLEKIQSLDDEAAELEANPQQAFEQLESKRAEERARQAAETERAMKSEFEKVGHDLKSKSPLLRTVDPTTEGGSDWNSDIKSAFTNAERMFGADATVQEQFERAVKGFRYDALEKMFVDTRKELKAAQTRLKEYEEASPDFQGRKKPVETVKKTPAEKYHEALAAAQGGEDEV